MEGGRAGPPSLAARSAPVGTEMKEANSRNRLANSRYRDEGNSPTRDTVPTRDKCLHNVLALSATVLSETGGNECDKGA